MIGRKIILALAISSLLVTVNIEAQTPATTATATTSANVVYIDPNTGELINEADAAITPPLLVNLTKTPPVSIKNISDMKFAVMQGALVKLPETLKAIQTNGNDVLAKVTWEPTVVDTRTGGRLLFSGSVEGYPKKVSLMIAVVAPLQTVVPEVQHPTQIDKNMLKGIALLTEVSPIKNIIEIPSKPILVARGPASYEDGILGRQIATAEQMARFLLSHNQEPSINCTALELATYYLEEGAREGVRGDIAFCQSIHETGWFRYGNQVQMEQNNYCGLGAVNPTDGQPVPQGAYFATPRDGVRAQIQHLLAYSSENRPKTELIDPRYQAVGKAHGFGCAYSWTDLNGRWAVPGDGYGEKIVDVFNKMMAQ